MDNFIVKLILAGLLIVIMSVTGIWVSRAGKPYPSLRFNILKLVSVGTVVFLFFLLKNFMSDYSAGSVLTVMTVITGIFFLLEIITGGILSALEGTNSIIQLIHKITPVLISAGTLVILILMFIAGREVLD